MGEKNLSEKSQLLIKLLIRRNGFEITTEGTISALVKEIDVLEEFTDKVSEKLGIAEEAQPEVASEPEVTTTPEEIEKVSTSDIPAVKPAKKTIDTLEALFNTPWGRTPRSIAEIMKGLEVNAAFDSVSSVNVYLTRLVQRGKLRRMQKEGKWVYFKVPE
jgi:hypothetical protein